MVKPVNNWSCPDSSPLTIILHSKGQRHITGPSKFVKRQAFLPRREARVEAKVIIKAAELSARTQCEWRFIRFRATIPTSDYKRSLSGRYLLE